jgi:hypothetical protein
VKRLRDVITNHNGTWSGRVADVEAPSPVGSTLPAASDQFISWASSYWPEVSPDEFEWQGLTARHRETGQVYRIRTGLPMGGEHESGIALFAVVDGRLALLADREDKPTSVVMHGEFDRIAKRVEYTSTTTEGLDGMVIN